jgi:serine/alanine adding enzyme
VIAIAAQIPGADRGAGDRSPTVAAPAAAAGERSVIRVLWAGDEIPASWDDYVKGNQNASVYHLRAWRSVIHGAYRKDAYYLIAESEGAGRVVGILPLVHMRHWLFGNSLVSMPFFDGGGVLADDPGIAGRLRATAVELASTLGADAIEFRQGNEPASESAPAVPLGSRAEVQGVRSVWTECADAQARVRMILDLPGDPGLLMANFKSKLRSQIMKPMKLGLDTVVGGVELLEDFYAVFAENMRDLGSPVHSVALIEKTLVAFPRDSRLFVVYGNGTAMAASLTVGFRQVLMNPWASALRRYRDLSPNMLLYWSMLDFACRNAYRAFDFGRSRVGEGTHKFKAQWGAREVPLVWHRITRNADGAAGIADRDRLSMAVRLWKRIPVGITKVIGPPIRARIGL